MNSSQRQPRSRIFDPDSQRQSDRPITPTKSLSPTPQQQQYQPQKLKHVLYNAQQSTPIVNCHYHPEQYIQNFCKNFDCLLPLCAACVKIHQDDHNDQIYPPHFDLLGSCLAEQYNKIVDICNLQAEDIENIVELKNIVKNHRETQKKKFLEAKEQFYKLIDSYMQQLENNLNTQSIQQTELLLTEINQFHRLAYDRWDDMQRRLIKLNSEKCLKTLIKSYKQSRPEDIFNKQHQLTLEFTDRVKQELDQVQIHPNKLQIIMEQLQTYISIAKEEPKQQQQQSPERRPQQVVRRVVQQPQQHVQQHVQQHAQQQVQQRSQSPIQTRVLQGFPIMQSMSPISTIERMQMPQMPQMPQIGQLGQIGQIPQIGQLGQIPQITPLQQLGHPQFTQMPPLPTGYPSVLPFPGFNSQMMPQQQQYLPPNIQLPFPQQYTQQVKQQQQIPQKQMPSQMPSQQQLKSSQHIPKQPLGVQVNVQPPPQDKPGEVIDLKQNNNTKTLRMAEMYHNNLYNDVEFSPQIDTS